MLPYALLKTMISEISPAALGHRRHEYNRMPGLFNLEDDEEQITFTHSDSLQSRRDMMWMMLK